MRRAGSTDPPQNSRPGCRRTSRSSRASRARGIDARRCRVRRRLTLDEAAARTGLDPEELRALEEGRIYRFPSVDDALAATLVYATALGIDEREARKAAGLRRTRGWSLDRWLAALGFAAAAVLLGWFVAVPQLRDAIPAATAVRRPRPRRT